MGEGIERGEGVSSCLGRGPAAGRGFLVITGLLWRWFRDVAYGGGSGNQIS